MPAFVRTRSVLRAELASVGGVTSAHRLHEAGALRLRFPNAAGTCEGILLNTAGGIAGGDHQTLSFTLAEGARAVITTQAAEKVYRADSDAAEIRNKLVLGPSAQLAWLPQETILFDGARLLRHIDVAIAADATLTLGEAVVFGRAARGERVESGQFHDRWRIRRSGRLILAEDLALSGQIADRLARPALGRGARAFATIVHVALDAGHHLAGVRAAVACDDTACEAGVSAWNGMLVARIAGGSPEAVRAACGRALGQLLPGQIPRIWCN